MVRSTRLFDDVWRPRKGEPLPTPRTLASIAARCGQAWDTPGLGRRVRIRYNPRLRTTIGRAFLEEDLIELNPRMLADHPNELIPTLVHELAHMVVHWRHGVVRPHGIEFRTLMRCLNLSPDATHSVPVGAYRVRRKRYLYLHVCKRCGASFLARRVSRQYYCGACGPRMDWEILRATDTLNGRRALQSVRRQVRREMQRRKNRR